MPLPTRKQNLETGVKRRRALQRRFQSALENAPMTQEQWRTQVFRVSRQHLTEMFKNKRPLYQPLYDAIDATIKKYVA